MKSGDSKKVRFVTFCENGKICMYLKFVFNIIQGFKELFNAKYYIFVNF